MSDLNLQLLEVDYLEKWSDMMATIWRERIVRFGAINTGQLHESVAQHAINISGDTITLSFDFVQYGIYVDAGAGRGYKRDNGGSLKFKSNTYRHEHNLGRLREKRPWLSTSWRISQQVLAEYIAKRTGYKLATLFSNL